MQPGQPYKVLEPSKSKRSFASSQLSGGVSFQLLGSTAPTRNPPREQKASTAIESTLQLKVDLK
jgi:hypothetical protein